MSRAQARGARRTVSAPDQRPVPRWAAVLGLAAAVLAAGALGTLVSLLGHPAPSPPAAPEPAADPRAAYACPAAPGDVPTGRDGLPAVDSNLLYECPDVFDGVRVAYTGEAVGAVLPRRGGVWLQLNDDVYAGELGPLPAHQDFRGGNAGVGVLAPPGVADDIAFVGGPRARGDVVEVAGRFLRADPVTREIAVIRADAARVVAPGEPLERALLRDRQVAAYVAVALALALAGLERAVARRRRRGV